MLVKDKNLICKYLWLKLLSVFLFFYILTPLAEVFPGDAQGDNFKDRRDPFISLVTNDGRLLYLKHKKIDDSLNLEGVIHDEYGISYAIVNGSVVRIGDSIGNYQVLKIEKNKVIFIKEGQTTEIELKKEEP
jgi:hypothetical protein